MRCTLGGLTGLIDEELDELMEQSRPFRHELWTLQQELEDLGKKLKDHVDQSESALLGRIAPPTTEAANGEAEPEHEDSVSVVVDSAVVGSDVTRT